MNDNAVPSAKLAAQVVDRLIQSGLLRAEKRAALVDKIAGGTMKSEDWRSEIDLAAMKQVSK